MKRCIINFAKHGREAWEQGQERLLESIKEVGEPCDVLTWNDLQEGWETIADRKNGFKMHCFDVAFKKGYDCVLWLDASAIVKKPLNYIWKEIEETGYFFVDNNSHTQAQWCSDAQIEAMGGVVSDAEYYQHCRGGVIGVNVSNRHWIEWGLNLPNIAFNGNNKSSSKMYVDDRHDQVVWSYLVYRDKLYKHPKELARYTFETDEMEIIEFKGII